MNESNATTPTEDPEDLEFELWLRVLHVVILLLLLLASITGNSLVLLLVICNKSLQYRSVISSLGLVIADMIIVLSWSLTGIGGTSAGQCPFGEEGCSILGAVMSVGIYARWCTVALITFERFCSIVFPFFYLKWSKPLLIVLVIFSWLIPLATIFPWLAGVGRYVYRLRYTSCTIFCDSDRACFQFYITLYGTFVTIGGILPMILYLLMCIIGQRKHYRMKHISLGTFDTPPAQDPESQNTQSTNDSSSIKERLNSNASSSTSSKQDSSVIPGSSTNNSISSKSKSDSDSNSGAKKKILTTFFMIFINVCSTQLPLYIISALRSKEDIYNSIPLWLHLVFVHIYLLGSVLDPLLIIRNTDFRDTIKKVLRRKTANTQSVSVKGVLLDFAKMSSLLEMTPNTGRRNMRRFSCPSTIIQKRAAMQQPVISKARSCDGYVYNEQETGLPMTIPSLILTACKEEGQGMHANVQETGPPGLQPLDGVCAT